MGQPAGGDGEQIWKRWLQEFDEAAWWPRGMLAVPRRDQCTLRARARIRSIRSRSGSPVCGLCSIEEAVPIWPPSKRRRRAMPRSPLPTRSTATAVRMTNRDWASLDQSPAQARTRHLLVVNDFTALAQSLPRLSAHDAARSAAGAARPNVIRVVVAPAWAYRLIPAGDASWITPRQRRHAVSPRRRT